MTRYVRRPSPPKAYVWRDSDDIWMTAGYDQPTCQVFEPEDKQVNSGLLDADGTPLYRDTSNPIGFIWDRP